MWIKIKKFGLTLSVIVLFGLYALQKQAQPDGGAAVVAAVPPTATSVSAVAQVVSTVPATGQTPSTDPDRLHSGANVTPTASVTEPRTSTQKIVVTPTATATVSGQYRDGSYTGSQADAHWGTVEVLAVVSNGQLSDVQFTEYPNHRNRSQEINSQAMPILTREAVQSQQAQVDVVSGATDTSEAFIQSLSSALSQAS
jgi:uncharacterized protein with FMN-binding domain